MKVCDAQTSFAAGELSPLLAARTDLAQYQSGARELTNFIVLPQGGIMNRAGTMRLGDHSGEAVRLVPFVYSSEANCVLAFWGDGTIRAYNRNGDRGQIASGTPYTTDLLPDLRWLQSGNTLYLFHPSVAVRALTLSDGSWTLAEVEFRNGPFRDLNTEPGRKLKVVEDGGSYILTNERQTGALYFYGVRLGGDIRFEVDVPSQAEDLPVSRGGETAFGDWVEVTGVFGAFTYRTSGSWWGTLEVQRKLPDGDWENYKTHVSASDAKENFSFSGDVEEYAYSYRFRYKGGNESVTVSFSWDGGTVYRTFHVDSWAQHREEYGTGSAAYVTATDGTVGEVPLTTEWALGAFWDGNCPRMGIFHQERLVLASSPSSPQTLWMSRPADWHNFEESIPVADDDAITVTLASKQIDDIVGMASRGDLLIFTKGGEWVAKAGSKSDVFTPSSIVITLTGYRGGADIPPLDVGGVTLFVQRQGTALRSIGYSLEVDGYASTDISVLAEHLFKDNPIVSMAYQQTPWSLVWCALSDGTAATLTLQQEHKVSAWSRQVFPGGAVRDLCVIPGDEQDDVFFAMERDGAVQVEVLRRREDINVAETFTDAGGATVSAAFESMDWEVATQRGTSQGQFKQVPAMTLRLYETKSLTGGILTENSDTLDFITFPGQSSPGPFEPGVRSSFTGDVRLLAPGGSGRRCRLRLEKQGGGPVTLLGIFPEVVIPEEGTVAQ